MWQGILSYWTLAGKFFVLLERYIFPTLLYSKLISSTTARKEKTLKTKICYALTMGGALTPNLMLFL
jgi:hypothetical protein